MDADSLTQTALVTSRLALSSAAREKAVNKADMEEPPHSASANQKTYSSVISANAVSSSGASASGFGSGSGSGSSGANQINAAAAQSHVTPGNVAREPQVLLKKLSVNLLKTYNLINQRYYARKREREAHRAKLRRNNGHDDENHDYIVKASEKMHDRYVVDSVIGKGSFGLVVKAYDMRTDSFVAIKIVKSKSAFYTQAQIEITILQSLQEADPDDTRHVVRMKDKFVHFNHQCIVFELLSFNLYELLRDTGFYGVSLNLIRKFGKQLLETLTFIGEHKQGVIHCDLKPENILLRSPRHSYIKVIDFGSACFQNAKMYTYIQSRFYRSPEVLLGCPYTAAIDMWSLGCILCEMHTGKPLFNGANEREQVVQQTDTLGLPFCLLETGRKVKKYFEHDKKEDKWTVVAPVNAKEAKRCERREKSLTKILGVHSGGPHGRRRNEKFGHTVRDYVLFEDLIRRMLDYNPATRITPAEALQHKFFSPSRDTGTMTDIKMPLNLSAMGPPPTDPEPPGVYDTPSREVSVCEQCERKGCDGECSCSFATDNEPSELSFTESEVVPATSSSAPPSMDARYNYQQHVNVEAWGRLTSRDRDSSRESTPRRKVVTHDVSVQAHS